MAKGEYSAVGRRKKAVARVRLVSGDGKIVINKRDIDNYFGLETLKMTVRQPMNLTNTGNWSADPRSSYEGAQEVRSEGCPPGASVQQALIISDSFLPCTERRGVFYCTERILYIKKTCTHITGNLK